MEFALKAENVSIRYITGDFKDIGIKEYVSRKATHNYHVNEFMAVDGVSFTLERGDMLGIVGTNGAGIHITQSGCWYYGADKRKNYS